MQENTKTVKFNTTKFDLKGIAQFISCLTHTHTNENSSFVYTRDSIIVFFKDP